MRWWPRPDSNRHSGFPEADFKSAVSTVPPRGPGASASSSAGAPTFARSAQAPDSGSDGCRRLLLERAAPDGFAGLDLEASSGPLLVHELALEHVGLLDLHMLVVGKDGSRRKTHQRG